jgi:hypothetical protein
VPSAHAIRVIAYKPLLHAKIHIYSHIFFEKRAKEGNKEKRGECDEALPVWGLVWK